MPQTLTPSQREAIEWTQKHRKSYERWNTIGKQTISAIGIILSVAFFAGYMNYIVLPMMTGFIPTFFFELGLLISMTICNFIIARFSLSREDAAAAVAVVAAVVAAAVAAAVAVVAAVVAVAVVVVVAVAVADSIPKDR
jgi:hypothetical protein